MASKGSEKNVSGSREQDKLQKTGNSSWLVCAAVLDCSQNVSGSREQKKLQRAGNSGRLVCTAVLDCSHLLPIVAKGIAHAGQCSCNASSLHNTVHLSS